MYLEPAASVYLTWSIFPYIIWSFLQAPKNLPIYTTEDIGMGRERIWFKRRHMNTCLVYDYDKMFRNTTIFNDNSPEN